jgi:hypothetical protein
LERTCLVTLQDNVILYVSYVVIADNDVMCYVECDERRRKRNEERSKNESILRYSLTNLEIL